MALDTPGHRTDEAFRRRRREARADLQDLRHERRIVRDPVAHDDPAARFRDANHLFRHVERLGREHRAKSADDEIEGSIGELPQIRRVALLEAEIGQVVFLRAAVPGLDEISRDVHAQDVRSALRFRQRSGAVAATEVEDFHSRRDADSLDERVSALAHGVGNAGKVAFFPQGLVWIGQCIRRHGRVPYLRTYAGW